MQQKLVFIGGLHRSGTALLARVLAEHPQVSGFRETSAPGDEGQYLQSVYPPASVYGGPGEFGFHPEAHLTEASPLVSRLNRERLITEWGRHWDLTRPVLLEQSPPNLIRTRFLQALFPEAYFVMIRRHPIAVALATGKFSVSQTDSLVRHWLVCHERFEQDRPHLERLHLLTYEDLIERPEVTLAGVLSFLELPPHPLEVETQAARRRHANYLRVWRELSNSPAPGDRAEAERIASRYGSRVARFGYGFPAPDPAAPAPQAGAPAAAADGGRPAPAGPDFLILGAQKAGTSSLFAYLSEHPEVVPPSRKELNFFNYGSLYRRGIELYREYFPRPTVGPDGTPHLTGEATPHYLFHPRVPPLVAEHFPRVRLLVILRNPVDRAYSHYQMVRRLTREETLTFEQAVEAEPERLRGEEERLLADPEYDSKPYRRYSYLARGVYIDQLLRWAGHFPREQMLILSSDELRSHPAATLDRVHQFLGLRPRSIVAHRLDNAYRYPPMDPRTRERLLEYFAPHDRRLYAYLGVDYRWQ